MVTIPTELTEAAARHHITIIKVEKWHDGRYWMQLFHEYHPHPDGSGEYVTARHHDLKGMCQDMVQYLTHTEEIDMDIFKESGLFDHVVGEMFLDDQGEPFVAYLTVGNVTMKGIHDGQGGKENKPIVHIKGNDKTIVLNKTNARAVASIYGRDTDNWIGKRIATTGEKGKWFGRAQTRVVILAIEPPPVKNGMRKVQAEEPTAEEVAALVAEHEAKQAAIKAEAEANRPPGLAEKNPAIAAVIEEAGYDMKLQEELLDERVVMARLGG